MSKEQLFLIDGHALCYRSFYAIRSLTTSKGEPTNAIYGFVRFLRSVMSEYRPAYLAVCFDSREKTLRQEKFAEYKIQRPSMPQELRGQIPIIREIIEAYNVPIFDKGGYEADDIIATIATKTANNNLEVIIASDDKDMYQVAGKNIKFYNSRSNSILDIEAVKEKLGIEPHHIVDLIGLAGDSSDNIPGVVGIGAVGAKKLINKYGDLESIIKGLEKEEAIKSKEQQIIDQRDAALFSKDLAILDLDVPIDLELKRLRIKEPKTDELGKLFQELEFWKFAEEISGAKPQKPQKVKIASAKNIKSLIEAVKKSKRCVFYFTPQDGDLFGESTLMVCDANTVHTIEYKEIKGLKSIFEDKNVVKVTYDIKRGYHILANEKISIEGDVFDCQLAGYLLGSSQASFELSNLSWQYLKKSIPDEQYDAAAAATIDQLYPKLLKELKSKKLLELFENIEMPLARVLFEVEQQGVHLDKPLLAKLSKECEKRINQLTKKLYKMAGEEFNLNSPKQLSHVLFEKLKLPVIKKTKTGFSTNEAVLNILAAQHDFPSLILEYRGIAKLKSTYIDALPKMINKKTDRVHAQFNQTGTETGRLSSSHPNLQNIPIRTDLGKQIRKAIIPSNSKDCLIAADYSQIELRVLAHLSGDKNLIRAFKNGDDIHTFTASLIFDVEEKDVTADMRNSAKRVNFGIIYGISAFGLSNDLKVTQPEAQEFINRYLARYPNVKKFMDDEIEKCEKEGYVLTIANRRRYIPEIKNKNGAIRQFAQRQAINTPVQGSAADLIKLAMIDIQKELKTKKFKTQMISSVHDELVFEGPTSEQSKLIKLVRDKMEHAVKLKVPVEVSIKVGKNWLDMEEV